MRSAYSNFHFMYPHHPPQVRTDRPIDDKSIDHEAPPRSTPLHHVEIVYDAVITRCRPTFYARSDSKIA